MSRRGDQPKQDAALQRTLDAEHAAVWTYGTLAALTSRSQQAPLWGQLDRAYAAHRARRDQLDAVLVRRGVTPHAAAVGYELANPADSPEQIRQLARGLETGLCETYADLVANSVDAERVWAVAALRESATRLVELGEDPQNWPGAADLD